MWPMNANHLHFGHLAVWLSGFDNDIYTTLKEFFYMFIWSELLWIN